MESKFSTFLKSKSLNITLNSPFISTEFCPKVEQQVRDILNNWINDEAVRRVWVEWITIDWKESLDLDDAIWAEKTKEWYCVWIHISDVAETIKLLSPLDLEAFKRTTSIYRKDNIINMFPKELANWLLSLNEDSDKKTMTLQIDLDKNWLVKNSSFYESKFKNIKKYNYDSFWEDYLNKDSTHYKTLHLLKEISDKLIINRLKNGAIFLYTDEDRRMFLWQKDQVDDDYSYSKKISHDIIWSLMILANKTTWEYLSNKWVNAIFKQHLKLDEKSFYTYKQWEHVWLWISNYTHFTSPIRRYVDVVIHRILKSIERWEDFPYNIFDLESIASHSNNTRLKIEIIWSHIDFEYKWKKFLEKTRAKLGRNPEVFEMKDFIRHTIHNNIKIPICMKDAIKEKIENSSVSTWSWVIWIILFWKDTDLKVFLKEKILNDNMITSSKILNILSQTQILRWEKTIFEIIEVERHNMFTCEVYLHWNKISWYSMYVWKLWNISIIKWIIRKKVITKVFDYFINI